MLDEKDILVCFTLGIFPELECFGNVKAPSSHCKRGREGTCKRIQIFWYLFNRLGQLQSLSALTLYLNVLRILSRVRGIIRIFRVTPNSR
jgi:hypothetical protein